MFNQNGSLQKAVINFANRRGLDVTIEEAEEGRQVWIWDSENECEPLLMYSANSDNSLNYNGSLFKKLEDLPVWIDSKQKFYNLLSYVSETLKSEKM